MWNFGQNAKHVLCNILETNRQINAKPTEHFIHIIINPMVEKRICHGPNSLTRNKEFYLGYGLTLFE